MPDVLAERPPATRPGRLDSKRRQPRAAGHQLGRVKKVHRRPVKRTFIWVHRWLSLVVGLFLIIETTTGAVLLYNPELQRYLHRESYAQVDPSAANGVSYQQAIDAVKTRSPDFEPGYVYDDAGTILVSDSDGNVATVDPSSGQVIGGWKVGERAPGVLAPTLALFENIHLCALTCEDDPLYVPWLVKEVPHSQWLGFESDGVASKITWGGLILGGLAVLLIFLALSGIWLWWPTLRHFKRGVRVRFRGNRYARDYDLHQVAGMIVVPLLLLWGLTGMSYELGFFEKAWYGALPGSKIEAPTVTSTGQGPELGYDQAVLAAQQAAHTDDRPVYYEVPAADDPTAPYSIWFSDGFDPWAGAGSSGGDYQVLVDRHDASRTAVGYGNPDESVAQHLYQDYNYPLHAGIAVNGWFRIIWLAAGLTPLLLAWTGVSTWLFKRTVRKRRRAAVRIREAERGAQDLSS